MFPHQLLHTQNENRNALIHVFLKILQMDEASYIKLQGWLYFHGIDSMEVLVLVMCHAHGINSAYTVNGYVQHLDS